MICHMDCPSISPRLPLQGDPPLAAACPSRPTQLSFLRNSDLEKELGKWIWVHWFCRRRASSQTQPHWVEEWEGVVFIGQMRIRCTMCQLICSEDLRWERQHTFRKRWSVLITLSLFLPAPVALRPINYPKWSSIDLGVCYLKVEICPILQASLLLSPFTSMFLLKHMPSWIQANWEHLQELIGAILQKTRVYPSLGPPF